MYEAGLMGGYSSGIFDPDGALSYAQIVTIAARLLDMLQGGDGVFSPPEKGEYWYMPYYRYVWKALEKKAVFIPDFLFSAYDPRDMNAVVNAACNRREFIRTLTYALLCADVTLPVLNKITFLPNLYALPHEDNNYSAMLARIIDPALRLHFTPKPFEVCRDGLGLAPGRTVYTVGNMALPAPRRM